MTPAELRTRRPLLFHLTYPENRPSIEGLGLLPAARLVAMATGSSRIRRRLLNRPRPTEERLALPDGMCRLRDNGVLSEAALIRCLDDLTPAAFCRLLNSHVFLWPTRAKVDRLLHARPYRGREHLLLTIPTASLSDETLDRLHVSGINSGSTLRRPARRGSATYVPLAEATGRQVTAAVEFGIRGGGIPADELSDAECHTVAAAGG